MKQSLPFTTVHVVGDQLRMERGNKGASEIWRCLNLHAYQWQHEVAVSPWSTLPSPPPSETPGAPSSCESSGNQGGNWSSWLSLQTKAQAFSILPSQLSPFHLFPFCRVSWYLYFTIVSLVILFGFMFWGSFFGCHVNDVWGGHLCVQSDTITWNCLIVLICIFWLNMFLIFLDHFYCSLVNHRSYLLAVFLLGTSHFLIRFNSFFLYYGH